MALRMKNNVHGVRFASQNRGFSEITPLESDAHCEEPACTYCESEVNRNAAMRILPGMLEWSVL
jgi:hypothetical protein